MINAPPSSTSSISISSIGLYLNLLDKLFLDWKATLEAAEALATGEAFALGLIPFGAHGCAPTGWDPV